MNCIIHTDQEFEISNNFSSITHKCSKCKDTQNKISSIEKWFQTINYNSKIDSDVKKLIKSSPQEIYSKVLTYNLFNAFKQTIKPVMNRTSANYIQYRYIDNNPHCIRCFYDSNYENKYSVSISSMKSHHMFDFTSIVFPLEKLRSESFLKKIKSGFFNLYK